jgi:hypothetical protein
VLDKIAIKERRKKCGTHPTTVFSKLKLPPNDILIFFLSLKFDLIDKK